MSQHTFTTADNQTLTVNLREWDSETLVGYEGFVDIASAFSIVLADLVYRFTVGGLSALERILVAAGKMVAPAMTQDEALDLLMSLKKGKLSAEQQRDTLQKLRGMGMEFVTEIDGKPVKAHLDWIYAGDKATGPQFRNSLRIVTEALGEKVPATTQTTATRANLPI